MNDPDFPVASRPPLRWFAALLIALLLLAAGGWAWQAWQQARQQAQLQARADAIRLQGLLDSVDALRRDQRATSARVQDAAGTNRVLRDEVLGLGQRSALLEENLGRLIESTRQGSQELHRDQAELLLVQASQRLEMADDLDGARRLYALAADQLAATSSADGLNLRQALMQERRALDAAGSGPRAQARERLATVARTLRSLPLQGEGERAAAPASTPWWHLALAPFVEMTPTRLHGPLTEAERVAGGDALEVELTLARAAIERGDGPAFVDALDRIEQGMTRLWPDSPALRRQRAELRSLRAVPLRLAAPELGSTLRQLRSLHDGGIP